MPARSVTRALALVAIGALVALGAAPTGAGAPAPAASANAACVAFPETGKQVCDRFLEYWQANGGLAQQGFPLTDAFAEVNPTDGRTYLTQYFERARFEWHKENAPPYDVLLGLLGREQYRAKYPGTPPPPFPGDPFNTPAYPQECATFPGTGKTVCSLFLAYWREHGGLAQQGLPLTDVVYEVNPTDGRPYPTQYFERARFEYHAEHAGTPHVVLLGLLGREQLFARYPNGVPGGQAPPASAPGASDWHAPTTHEHGDPPPAWVLASGHPPFTQSRESHVGYKGAYARDRGGKGVESYLIAHVVSSATARMHGDHDYQLWLRAPGGEIAYFEGMLDFGNPPPLRTTDTGERPIVLSVNDGGCETWYSRPGALVLDVGWTICGRYQRFDGGVRGGVGAFRTMDWVIPCDRLPAASPLRGSCTVEFGVSRLSFLVNSKDYGAPGLIPVN